MSAPEAPPADEPKKVVRIGDRAFQSLATGSGIFVVALIAAIGIFLLIRAVPSLQANQVNFLFSRVWDTSDPNELSFGIADLAWVTVASSLVALVFAMPIACGIALFLTQYAPRSLARPFAYIVDLLAAVPSVIYGLWGVLVLGPVLKPVALWLNQNLGWIPIFADGNAPADGGMNIFTAGIVLAVMILPTITGVTREVFQRTPKAHIEGAQALGATRWEVVRTTVWPFGRNGFIGGSMLGLGRALGETVALTVILSTVNSGPNFSLFDVGATFASKIALGSGEFNNNMQVGAYISAGLVLFVITFAVNALARWIESASGKGKS
ncbi:MULTISPECIES: phosphate ABC transporter permease subunit PstC [Saccharopolyspora]|uniref:phosphate ABC transporter permease subunit PstC n=1 Tax=Saccharopolyspora TaxID=1835 RepID=UPI001CD7FC5D|nr:MULTISPECIES: phosphate ABC transporter permease subunit PstC [Saccharopolyspora]MCA1186460.1 phosphate ABC transporter permease subunit PstC [Saccharopolyspora sp. 6T]MCA1192919.1 phosphate ABC transporter permease subunit PstC [Saccharopolyspora sp. 6V]MCA1226747.1 phosphate ABC transporter permease subunit PstC [Saccharopolyspora sp. 6M]MCA1282746.1 phosphate ABC transporter permease subunit PstC [Saccharopolyspora sp. 7B]